MTNIQMKVLNLFENELLSFEETEILLHSLSNNILSTITQKTKTIVNNDAIYIPPHLSTYFSNESNVLN